MNVSIISANMDHRVLMASTPIRVAVGKASLACCARNMVSTKFVDLKSADTNIFLPAMTPSNTFNVRQS